MQRDLGPVLDIVLACRDVEDFIAGLAPEDFLRASTTDGRRTVYAVLHRLMVIGEAVKRLSSSFREEHADVPWKRVAGLRDQLIHGYDEVNLAKIWELASQQVPILRRQLEPLIPPAAE